MNVKTSSIFVSVTLNWPRMNSIDFLPLGFPFTIYLTVRLRLTRQWGRKQGLVCHTLQPNPRKLGGQSRGSKTSSLTKDVPSVPIFVTSACVLGNGLVSAKHIMLINLRIYQKYYDIQLMIWLG